MPVAQAQPDDDPAVVAAINKLLAAGFDVRRPSRSSYQIKLTPDLSFYPTTGRIVPDGKPALSERGIDAAIELLVGKRVLEGALR